MRLSGKIHWLLPSLLWLLAIPAFAANHVVTVGGFNGSTPKLTYVPAQLTVNVGDTVTFNNAGGFHNVWADSGAFRCAAGCDGVGSGSGNPVSAAWSATIAFNAPGTFGYYCEVHGSPGVGMFGSITVQGTTPPPTPTALGPGFTGAWYNPAQDGHGVFLEILPGDRIVAAWYVFTPGGQQAWVVGVGTITDNTASVPVQIAGGARFMPNFDPTQVVRTNWGTLNFTFTDCNTGSMAFASTVTGYGSGTIPLSRVTLPAGLTCTPPTGVVPLQ